MADWRSWLRADPTAWLLEDDNPSVRYLTLVDILDKSHADLEVAEARAAIMTAGVVPAILERQHPEGHWGSPGNPYAKYGGSVWQLVILAELAAEGSDERICRACGFILEALQDVQSYGFSYQRNKRSGGGRHSGVIPCLTGNLVWSLLRLGWGDDPRVRLAVQWIVRYQRFDDVVDDAPTGWPYDVFVDCWGRHTCHMGAVKALKALAEIPAADRSDGVRRTIEEGAEYVLRHRIHKRSHDLTRVSKPGWLRLGFPRMYQTDVLEVLGILTRLGYHDERMRDALDVVVSKQDADGRWTLADTFNGRFLVDIEDKGKPSKWVTLNALRVLKAWA